MRRTRKRVVVPENLVIERTIVCRSWYQYLHEAYPEEAAELDRHSCAYSAPRELLRLGDEVYHEAMLEAYRKQPKSRPLHENDSNPYLWD
jgi:hypothetical protein